MCCLRKFWNDNAGVIISAELVLILTIVVIGVLVGLVSLRDSVAGELTDVSRAISNLNQSYGYSGFRGGANRCGGKMTSFVAGSTFIDANKQRDIVTTGDFGRCSSVATCLPAVAHGASYGTIVLSDSTLIPLTWVASGTWSCPGGILLAATSAESTTLRLADGKEIPFLLGRAGTLLFESGKVAVVSPGLKGTLILPDRAVAVLDTTDLTIAVLADGTRATFRPLDPNLVLLPDGTTVEVKAGDRSTLILPDGRVLDLHHAILPTNMEVTPPAPAEEKHPQKNPPKSKKTVMVS